MEDLRRKRTAIERGELREWTARGRSWKKVEKSCLPRLFLRTALRLTRLENRGRRNALSPVVRRLRFAYPNLPGAFDGFTIVHLSDLHIDGVPGLPDRVSELLAGIEADVCVLTGDYRYKLDGSSDGVFGPMRRILGRVRTRHGILAILGNHDTSNMVAPLEGMGVRVLINAAAAIRRGEESIWFVGLDDPHYFGCEDLATALAPVPEGAFKVLLVHSPEMVEDAAAAGINLYLCGHTHGGQIRLPAIGPVVINSNCPRRYTAGVWHFGNLKGYTSLGLGSSVVPARFHCPPEIALLELRRSAQGSTGS